MRLPHSIDNWIDGRSCPAASGARMDVVDPATGDHYATMAASRAEDVDAAWHAARRALPGWSGTSAAERSALLRRLADLVERDVERLAYLESVDSGKPLGLARSVDIPRAAANLRFFARLVQDWRPDEELSAPNSASLVMP